MTSYKPQRTLAKVDPLHFADVRAKIDMGGIDIRVNDGFLLPDEAEALHAWLGKALTRPVCDHKWFHAGGGKYRCKLCRADKV